MPKQRGGAFWSSRQAVGETVLSADDRERLEQIASALEAALSRRQLTSPVWSQDAALLRRLSSAPPEVSGEGERKTPTQEILAMKELPDWATVPSSLCGNCGQVSPADAFEQLIHDYDGRFGPEGALVAVPDGEEVTVERCPACGFEHEDNDSGPGTWVGSRIEMEVERERLIKDPIWAEGWIEVWVEIATKTGEHASPPEPSVQEEGMRWAVFADGSHEPRPDGEWVRFSDYHDLQARLEKAGAERDAVKHDLDSLNEVREGEMAVVVETRERATQAEAVLAKAIEEFEGRAEFWEAQETNSARDLASGLREAAQYLREQQAALQGGGADA